MVDDSFSADIAMLQHAKIYFAHQSVGGNILNGIALLSANNAKHTILPGGAVLQPLTDVSNFPDEYFTDAAIGENTRPETKCAAFVSSFGRFKGVPPDIAFMKFCYVDFGQAMTAGEIFSLYASTIDSLRRSYPSCTFVHVTAPLTARKTGVKEFMKRLIGRGDRFESDNAERNAYNRLLRDRFNGEPMFDLAAVESTHADGTRETYDAGGALCYAMAPEYTDDGGHLNEAGQIAAARELVYTLAQVLRSVRNDSVRVQP